MREPLSAARIPAHPLCRALRGLGLLGASFALASSAAAQSVADTGPVPASLLDASHGAVADADGILAGGRDYRARFLPGTVHFTPALGPRAPRTLPLEFSLETIEREGAVLLEATGRAEPRLSERRVTYGHGGGLQERYDVTEEGLEQSFLFPSRPAGSGDLVVRGRIRSDLIAAPAVELGVGPRFELPGVGAVTFGSVTGVDANGARVDGTIQLLGSVLELRLPGDFVDAAAYPLVLDPLIGAQIDVDTSVAEDGTPDVAYDGDEATYFVVWNRVFSLVDADIRGQRVDNTGALVGGTIFVTSGANLLALQPAVASIDVNGRFLVCWEEVVLDGSPVQIRAAGVDADDGRVSASILVDSSPNNQSDVAVGGERTLLDDDAVVVWKEDGVGILARQITLQSAGSPLVTGGSVTIEPETVFGGVSDPAISRSGGDAGMFLITYTGTNLLTLRTTIVAEAWDRNLVPVGFGTATVSDLATFTNDRLSAVDGDGENWIVAYERERTIGSADSFVVVRPLRLSGSLLSVNGVESFLGSGLGTTQERPAVSFTGRQTLVAFEELDPLEGITLESVDPFTGLPSGERLEASPGFNDPARPALASQYSGGGNLISTDGFDDVLAVWDTVPFGGSSTDVVAYRYDSGSGPNDLGGECGGGGELLLPCLFEGNGNFAVRLEGAPASRPTFLTISGGTTSVACGPCVLVPALDGSNTTFTGMTDVNGVASFPIAVPPGVAGGFVVAQALTFEPGGPCSMFAQVRLSAGTSATID